MPSARAGGTPIQFQPSDSEDVFWRKLKQLAQLVNDLATERSSTGTTSTVTIVETLPSMGSPRLLGRASGTGAPAELSPTEVNLLLPTFTASTKGLVTAPGTATGTRFLRDDGSWATISVDLSGLEHGALAGLTNDDHPQYLLRADQRDYMRAFLFLGA